LNTGQKDKGRASPASVSPSKLPKFQTVLPLSNGNVALDSVDGFESRPVGPLSGFQEEELCVEGMKVLNPFNNVQHSHELDVSYLIMVY
jgi:hypothetical protein